MLTPASLSRVGVAALVGSATHKQRSATSGRPFQQQVRNLCSSLFSRTRSDVTPTVRLADLSGQNFPSSAISRKAKDVTDQVFVGKHSTSKAKLYGSNIDTLKEESIANLARSLGIDTDKESSIRQAVSNELSKLGETLLELQLSKFANIGVGRDAYLEAANPTDTAAPGRAKFAEILVNSQNLSESQKTQLLEEVKDLMHRTHCQVKFSGDESNPSMDIYFGGTENSKDIRNDIKAGLRMVTDHDKKVVRLADLLHDARSKAAVEGAPISIRSISGFSLGGSAAQGFHLRLGARGNKDLPNLLLVDPLLLTGRQIKFFAMGKKDTAELSVPRGLIVSLQNTLAPKHNLMTVMRKLRYTHPGLYHVKLDSNEAISVRGDSEASQSSSISRSSISPLSPRSGPLGYHSGEHAALSLLVAANPRESQNIIDSFVKKLENSTGS